LPRLLQGVLIFTHFFTMRTRFCDCIFHVIKVQPSSRGSAFEVVAPVPVTGSSEYEPGHFGRKLDTPASSLRFHTEIGQAINVRLILCDFECFKVLDNRVR